MKTLNIFLRSALAFILALQVACTRENDDKLLTDGSVNIESFSINGASGVIDNIKDEITITLPYGSSLISLAPQITLPAGATSSPNSGSSADFTRPVKYRILNGNIYKDYMVTVKAQDPITSFLVNGLQATINNTSKSIKLIVPDDVDLTTVKPVITVAPGVSISPTSQQVVDFSSPVVYTVTNGKVSDKYTVTVTHQTSGPTIAFLGTAASRAGLTNPDEITAVDWLFSKYPTATYISFAEIEAGDVLKNIQVVWWHYDSATSLPAAALSNTVTGKIKTYLNTGGNILLTSFASQYTEALGIVPAGKGPNNVFGDFLPNGFVENGSNWGMAFRQNHPIFEGLTTYEPGKANLLQKGTFRTNHTAWWFLPEWGGYTDGAGWRTQTGGNNLASEAWDNGLNGRVSIAEFPGSTGNKNCIVISMGAYDWYNETANGVPIQENSFIGNIKLLTSNSLEYLVTH